MRNFMGSFEDNFKDVKWDHLKMKHGIFVVNIPESMILGLLFKNSGLPPFFLLLMYQKPG